MAVWKTHLFQAGKLQKRLTFPLQYFGLFGGFRTTSDRGRNFFYGLWLPVDTLNSQIHFKTDDSSL